MPLLRRRRPLLRAAAVGGGAYAMGKQRARSQEREAEQEARLSGLEQEAYAPPASAPAPAPTAMSPDVIEQLKQLGQLREQGVLTDQEFAAQKAKLLGT
jgi:hypothetical protein